MLIKKIKENHFSIGNTRCIKTEAVIKKLQHLKGRINLKFYQNKIICYNEINYRWQSKTFQFQESAFAGNAKSISENFNETSILMKFLQIDFSV